MAVGVLSGCTVVDLAGMVAGGILEASREIDTRGAWSVKTSKYSKTPILPTKGRYRIRRGKTTKSEVLTMLFVPEELTRDDRFFLYRYEMQIYKVRKKDKIVVERIPEGRLREARFLIWFDQADIVKRYKLYRCGATFSSMFSGVNVKCNSANQMCAMIKGLKDKQLIAQYC
jgi:hypothetical protein